MANKKITVITLFLLLCYLNAVNSGKFLSEDVIVGSFQVLLGLSLLELVTSPVKYNASNFLRTFFTCRWLRVFTFVVFVFTFVISVIIYRVVITFLDWSIDLALDFCEKFLSKLESNIYELNEDRPEFDTLEVHPVTMGLTHPKTLQQMFRYPMEDAEMKCHVRLLWLSRGRPFPRQIVWRKDGSDVTDSDRYRQRIQFREMLDSDTYLRELGLSWYEVNSSLTLSLLQDEDFGTYTCHFTKFLNIAIHDYLAMYAKLLGLKGNVTDKGSPPITPVRNPEHRESPGHSQQTAELPKQLFKFQDTYTWYSEFRLSRKEQREEIIYAPPGAILVLKTSYWHLSEDEELEIDYKVNGKSYDQLCHGFLSGCSKVLFLYWQIKQAISFWNTTPAPAKQHQHAHCVCEHAYGNHSVQYLRRYFNQTKQKYELIEIEHPRKLVVFPRKQDMFEVYTDRSSSLAINTSQMLHLLVENPELIKEMASAFSELFMWKEGVVLLAVILIICCLLVFGFVMLLKIVPIARHMILERSVEHFVPGMTRQAEGLEYDVFLSYSDDDEAQVTEMVLSYLEVKGFKVFSRNRDIPANMQELSAISTAVEKSKRFLIIATRSYFDDSFTGFEVDVILEHIYGRRCSPREILIIIKLNPCKIPLRLRQFCVHDWTLCLSLEFRQRKLLQWLLARDFFWAIVCLLLTARGSQWPFLNPHFHRNNAGCLARSGPI